MANHKSAQKRVRSDEKKRDRNRYQHKTTRNAVRDLRASSDAKEAGESFKKEFRETNSKNRKQPA